MKRDSSTMWFMALAVSVVVAAVVVIRRRRSHHADPHGSSTDDLSSHRVIDSSDTVIDGSGKDSFPASDPPATY